MPRPMQVIHVSIILNKLQITNHESMSPGTLLKTQVWRHAMPARNAIESMAYKMKTWATINIQHLCFTPSDAMKHFRLKTRKIKNNAPLWGLPTEQFQSQDSNNMACHTLRGMQHNNRRRPDLLQQSDKNIQKHRTNAPNIVINH